MATKTELRNLLPDLAASKGYVLDEIEDFTIDAAGEAYMIADSDGVDGPSGESLFLKLGKL
ncbi:hypothetical protein [Microvirga aerophila]|uniref:hypothetical protein n=1 Tax=Microvirga aerophila TaxID=670291 RepID=UPI0011BF4A58|nr:hypothetical protein [Microvirga aerophila]